MQNPIAFALGLTLVVFAARQFRLDRGMKLQLLLVHREGMRSLVEGKEGHEQVVIPVTLEGRRSLSWRGIREGRWKESEDLVLADDDGKYADLAFSFHPWRHYLLVVGPRPVASETADVKLNSKKVPTGKGVRLVDGDRLDVGRRRYSVRVRSSSSEFVPLVSI